MKKFASFLSLVLVLGLGLTGCGGKSVVPSGGDTSSSSPSISPTLGGSKESAESANQVYKTNGNTLGQNSIMISGDWIYFSNEKGIFKIKTDKSGQEMLYAWEDDGQAVPLFVVDDWIYYKSRYAFKIKTDGSQRQQISDVSFNGDFRVVGDWIYSGSEYKMKLDGSDFQQFNNPHAAAGFSTNFVDGWIYCYDNDENDNDVVYKMKTDGSEKRVIYENRTDYMVADGEWLYYVEYDSEDIYKMKLDGSENQLFVEDGDAWSINAADGWVYWKSDGVLYKIKTDGSEKQLLSEGGSASVIMGDWMYYGFSQEESGRQIWTLYRMKTDGSGKEVICAIDLDTP